MENINYEVENFDEFVDVNGLIIAEEIAKEQNDTIDNIFESEVIDRAREMYDEFVDDQNPFIKSEPTEDYPLGGMVEPYDIERDKDLTN